MKLAVIDTELVAFLAFSCIYFTAWLLVTMIITYSSLWVLKSFLPERPRPKVKTLSIFDKRR